MEVELNCRRDRLGQLDFSVTAQAVDLQFVPDGVRYLDELATAGGATFAWYACYLCYFCALCSQVFILCYWQQDVNGTS